MRVITNNSFLKKGIEDFLFKTQPINVKNITLFDYGENLVMYSSPFIYWGFDLSERYFFRVSGVSINKKQGLNGVALALTKCRSLRYNEINKLTLLEEDILLAIYYGADIANVASANMISEKTAYAYKYNALRKMSFRNTTEFFLAFKKWNDYRVGGRYWI